MPTLIHKSFHLYNKDNIADVEFYLNKDGDIFVQELHSDDSFFFVINKDDWIELKKYIDEQFENHK